MTPLQKAIKLQNDLQELTIRTVDSDPWVPIKIGPRELKFELSYGAVCEVFRETGLVLNLLQITPSMIYDPRVFPKILMAGLRTHNEGLLAIYGDDAKQEQAILAQIPIRHMNYYQTIILRALQAVEPDPEEIQRINEQYELSAEPETQDPLTGGSTSEDSGHAASNVEYIPKQ